MSKIGFNGTGIMGRHVAEHLYDRVHELYLYQHRSLLPEELPAGGVTTCASHGWSGLDHSAMA